ncbi:MAG: GGDEF domain-containing protein, partial [Verrucomicrobia bacterium]|nr:GGDEF domain-containing protein [Verrucomicrobiota bacterium]
VLRALAEVGRVHARKTCVFARLGGDEFAALLPGKDLEHACSMAENLRTAIEQQNFVYKWPKDQAIPFTVTIGVAERAPGEADVTDVLKRADQALYKAKEGGKNRVVCG